MLDALPGAGDGHHFRHAQPDVKSLRIRFTCNGQTTPGQRATENGIADLRCERFGDLNK